VQKDLLLSVITGEVPFRFLNNKFLKWAFAVGVHIKLAVCFTLFCFRMLCTRTHAHAHAHAHTCRHTCACARARTHACARTNTHACMGTHMRKLYSSAVELEMDTML
jgi:hypothetical protein